MTMRQTSNGAADDSADLKALVEARLGLSPERGGVSAAIARFVQKRLGPGATGSPGALVARLKAGSEPDFDELINAVTIPHSWFFRDLEQLVSAMAFLRDRATSEQRPVRVWVPACATGEDAYSLSALAREQQLAIEILGTDINERALERARNAAYGSFSVRDVPERFQKLLTRRADGLCQLAEEIRSRVTLLRHNLIEKPPASKTADGSWDLILCRNVFIYLTREHVRHSIQLMREALAEGGALILGASDIVFEPPQGFSAVPFEGRLVFIRGSRPGAQSSRPELPLSPSAFAEHATFSSRVAPASENVPPKPLSPAVSHPPSAQADGPRAEPMVAEDRAAAVEEMRGGIATYLEGDLQGAAKRLRAALFLDDRLWPAAYYLALCCEGLGHANDARRQYARVVALIDSGTVISGPPEDGYRFLEQDVLGIARRRCMALSR